jgi:hypothetical protein
MNIKFYSIGSLKFYAFWKINTIFKYIGIHNKSNEDNRWFEIHPTQKLLLVSSFTPFDKKCF